MSSELKKLFAARKEKILKVLENFLFDKNTRELLDLPWNNELPEILLEYTTRGKCLRGNLVILGYVAAGGRLRKNAPCYQAAAAIELFQSGILMHDDLIDDDNLRRGKPSCHKFFEEFLLQKNFSHPEKNGRALALCLGDIALMLTFSLLEESKVNHKILRLVTSEWGSTFASVGAAEMEDSYLAETKEEISLQRILNLYLNKTASYTFMLPLITGALLKNAKQSFIAKLTTFSLHLGTLFQIKDDELGIFGSEKALGKPIGSDIRENKKTIFRELLFAAATKSEKIKLEKIFGRENVSEKDVAFVRTLMENHGVTKKVQTLKTCFAKNAEAALENLTSPKIENIFRQLIAYSLERQN